MSASKGWRCHFFLNHAHLHITISIHKKNALKKEASHSRLKCHEAAGGNANLYGYKVVFVHVAPISSGVFGIVLMGWSLVCACWQSVRNICFGRCCGHMIPSIHKVPACPFTALYTVSHCTDDHTMITFPTFIVQHITYIRECSSVSGLFHTSTRKFFFFFLNRLTRGDFSSIMYLSQRKSYALSAIHSHSLMFDTHPCFSPSHWSSAYEVDWFDARRLCPWTTLVLFCVICRVCCFAYQ